MTANPFAGFDFSSPPPVILHTASRAELLQVIQAMVVVRMDARRGEPDAGRAVLEEFVFHGRPSAELLKHLGDAAVVANGLLVLNRLFGAAVARTN